MSLKMQIYRMLPTSKFEEYLVFKFRSRARELYSQEVVDEIFKKAEKFSNGERDKSRDETSGWLIETFWRAGRQLKLLDKCSSFIGQARSMQVEDKLLGKFVDAFSKSVGIEVLPGDLESEVSGAKKRWQEIREKIMEVPPPMSFSHVFLGIKNRSGIEATSLIIGTLVVLGAVYMSISYDAVAGVAAYKYWAIDDLILRGMLVAPLCAFIWFIVGFFFSRAPSFLFRKLNYFVNGWIVAAPVAPAFILLIVTAILTSALAYGSAMYKTSEFAQMTESSAQMATMADGTVLNNVYLVGTTNRTAIFLKAEFVDEQENSERFVEWRGEMERFLECRGRGYFNVLEGGTESPEPCTSYFRKPYEIVVMDRALIVCHAQMGKCEQTKKRGASDLL